ncbi:carbohydrate sulfotransferase 15-like isoform X2 [Dreissena polymorpha]|nr:carbohydrate sulfotransferase 15-like isoform X2 [Dreissena polymorpha]
MQSKNRYQYLMGKYRRKLTFFMICGLLLLVSYISMLSSKNSNINAILGQLKRNPGENNSNAAPKDNLAYHSRIPIGVTYNGKIGNAIQDNVRRKNVDMFSDGLNIKENGIATASYMYTDGAFVRDNQSKEFNLTQRSKSGQQVFGWISTLNQKNEHSGEGTEDLMTLKPFSFLKTYRNPCWYGDAFNYTGDDVAGSPRAPARIAHRVFCLPYYYLVGAPKCGTTDLFIKMVQHPEVSRSVPKEPHWVTRRRFFKDKKFHNISSYFQIFSMATLQIVQSKLKNGYHPLVFGDHSASTLWDNDFWTILPQFANLTEPPITAADVIHHLNPNAKIIAMLRNPTERLYSDYLFFNQGDKSPESFHKGVSVVLESLKTCLAINSLRHCLYKPPSSEPEFHIRARIGVYHQYLKEYFRVFPASQILVLKLEDYSKAPAEIIQKIFEFLELSAFPPEKLSNITKSKNPANSRRTNDSTIGPMLPETRRLLQNFYWPHNEQLGALLGKTFNYNLDEIN